MANDWQTYIDDQMVPAGFMYAAIYAHDGTLWASTPGFTVGPEELQIMDQALRNEDLGKISAAGFTIATQKYTFTRGEVGSDDGSPAFCQGRCKEEGKTSQGCIVYCTNQAFLIGVHDPNYTDSSFGKVNTEAGRIADYLMDSGY
ncbi:unnamed protein product [Agarophyton chilense]|eukprot:gb/GEZJ01001247.1/.p2 GENE.gb/GEZJ01001247.1/~~gb/GEZJ01001247.1/.p2  ORF type:complete len:145 (-),score=18.38 gb/GEZJ01001247.1/:468-902(-)